MTWVTVDEAIPAMKCDECTITVLCFLDRDWMVSGYYDICDDEWYDPNGEIIDGVMQWMPLPDGPQ